MNKFRHDNVGHIKRSAFSRIAVARLACPGGSSVR